MNNLEKMFKIKMAGNEEESLIGLRVQNDYLTFTTLKGPAVTPEMFEMLMIWYFSKVINRGIELSKNRIYPIRVRSHEGFSGCIDMWVEYLIYKNHFPIVGQRGKVHISMYGKLNEGIEIWLGDLVELFDFDPNCFQNSIEVKEINIYRNKDLEDFHKGGER